MVKFMKEEKVGMLRHKMKEYIIRSSDYLYKDNRERIRCIFCKCFISKRLGYCERCIEGYEKREIKKIR
jgi:hypothetical protein